MTEQKKRSQKDMKYPGYDPNAVGDQKITVTYEGVSATFTVTVKASEKPQPTLDKIELSGDVKTEYTQGEKLDLSKLVVTAVYSDGSKAEIKADDYTVSGYDPNTVGEQTVTVTYGGKTASFTVTVKEGKQPSNPSQPSNPGQPSDTQKPSDNQGGSQTGSTVKTGDTTNLFLPAGGMLMAAALLFVAWKRRRIEK